MTIRPFAALALLLVAACHGPAPAKRAFLDETLAERAPHLEDAQRARIADALVRAESEFGVDALLLAVVAERESHFRAGAESRKKAFGIMQLRGKTARAVAARNAIAWSGEDALSDPATSIRIAAAYLAELEQELGSLDLALTAYSHGPTRAREIKQRGTEPSSRYAKKVLAAYRALGDVYQKGVSGTPSS